MLNHHPPNNALINLQRGEICILHVDGKDREAIWDPYLNGFHLKEQPYGFVPAKDAQWRPAGVRF
jgi:hypothetical protein